MPQIMHYELKKIRKRMLSLGILVEDVVRMATRAIENQDADMAQKIIKLDQEIDELEVEIEEECLKVLALHQPVAVDLRFLITAIKITNDLERVGDLATNIANNVMTMAQCTKQFFVFDFAPMAEQTEIMLQLSLDAMVNLDIQMAQLVVQMDNKVDRIQQDVYDRVKQTLRSRPEQTGYLLNLLLISRHLERLADHATNISEEVIYLIEGNIARHQTNEQQCRS